MTAIDFWNLVLSSTCTEDSRADERTGTQPTHGENGCGGESGCKSYNGCKGDNAASNEEAR